MAPALPLFKLGALVLTTASKPAAKAVVRLASQPSLTPLKLGLGTALRRVCRRLGASLHVLHVSTAVRARGGIRGMNRRSLRHSSHAQKGDCRSGGGSNGGGGSGGGWNHLSRAAGLGRAGVGVRIRRFRVKPLEGGEAEEVARGAAFLAELGVFGVAAGVYTAEHVLNKRNKEASAAAAAAAAARKAEADALRWSALVRALDAAEAAAAALDAAVEAAALQQSARLRDARAAARTRARGRHVDNAKAAAVEAGAGVGWVAWLGSWFGWGGVGVGAAAGNGGSNDDAAVAAAARSPGARSPGASCSEDEDDNGHW